LFCERNNRNNKKAREITIINPKPLGGEKKKKKEERRRKKKKKEERSEKRSLKIRTEIRRKKR